MVASNVPVPLVTLAGTSLNDFKLAFNRIVSSSATVVATLKTETSRASNRNFFMFGFSPSLDDFGRILGRCGGVTPQPEFPISNPSLRKTIRQPYVPVNHCSVKAPLIRGRRYLGLRFALGSPPRHGLNLPQ